MVEAAAVVVGCSLSTPTETPITWPLFSTSTIPLSGQWKESLPMRFVVREHVHLLDLSLPTEHPRS